MITLKKPSLVILLSLNACQPQDFSSTFQPQVSPSSSPLPKETPHLSPIPLAPSPSAALSSPQASSQPVVLLNPQLGTCADLQPHQHLELEREYELPLKAFQQHCFAFSTVQDQPYTLFAGRGSHALLRYIGPEPELLNWPFRHVLTGVSSTFQAKANQTYVVLEPYADQTIRLEINQGTPQEIALRKYPIPSTTPEPWQNRFHEADYKPFAGRIFDDQRQPLADVKVNLRALSSFVDLDLTTTTNKDGKYSFSVPAGIQYAVTATKPGFTTRRRVEVLTYSLEGGYDYDFGEAPPDQPPSTGKAYNAMSDGPEVVKIFPNRYSSDVDPQTAFVLTFSEPMDRQSVEALFAIRTYNNRVLSADMGHQRGWDPITLTGSNSIDLYNLQNINGTPIWDHKAFDIQWNADDTEVTLRFKPDHCLPSDKDPKRVPDYQVALQNFKPTQSPLPRIRDKAGNQGPEKPFKLTDGPFEPYVKFSILPDHEPPRFQALQWQGGLQQPRLVLQFSKPMRVPTVGRLLAGGMNHNISQAAMALPEYWLTGQEAAQNYLLTVKRQGQVLAEQSWASLGGVAIAGDSRREVVLQAGDAFAPPDWQTGDELVLEVAPTVLGPAGNPIEPNANQQTLSIP